MISVLKILLLLLLRTQFNINDFNSCRNVSLAGDLGDPFLFIGDWCSHSTTPGHLSAAVHKSHTANNSCTAQDNQNELNEYERGKNLIQWEHPSNDLLLSTRQGFQSTPDKPAKSVGAQLDHTKGNLLFTGCFTSPLLGLKDKGRTIQNLINRCRWALNL